MDISCLFTSPCKLFKIIKPISSQPLKKNKREPVKINNLFYTMKDVLLNCIPLGREILQFHGCHLVSPRSVRGPCAWRPRRCVSRACVQRDAPSHGARRCSRPFSCGVIFSTDFQLRSVNLKTI